MTVVDEPMVIVDVVMCVVLYCCDVDVVVDNMEELGEVVVVWCRLLYSSIKSRNVSSELQKSEPVQHIL